jgi:hypothetical protein
MALPFATGVQPMTAEQQAEWRKRFAAKQAKVENACRSRGELAGMMKRNESLFTSRGGRSAGE